MKIDFPLDCLKDIPTPFYYYDIDVLDQTLHQLQREAAAHASFSVHYAVKANANPRILQRIRQAGLGADCVSGGEIEAALQAGFKADGIVFAGVGKSDWEIELALRNDIFCFNVESREELEVINLLAEQMGKTAQVCFRINPEVGAHTHEKITTGKAENKFGIAMTDLESVIHLAMRLPSIRFIGLHFHIGSQILEMDDFKRLCFRINHLQDRLEAQGIVPKHINVGGHRLRRSAGPCRAIFQSLLRHLRPMPASARRPAGAFRAGTRRRRAMRCADLARIIYKGGRGEAFFDS